MTYLPEVLREDVIKKRIIDLKLNLREAAEEIGTSAATLSRLEHSKPIDMETFAKVCTWLGNEPTKYFYIVRPRQDGFRTNNP